MTPIKQRANSKRAARREQLISIVRESSLACGKALMELRDDEHWRETHTSFGAFCQEVFDIKGTYLWNLLKSVEVVESLPEPIREHITNEVQARALQSVPVESRAAVVQEAVNSGPVNARTLAEAHQRLKTGTPIENPVLPTEPEPKPKPEKPSLPDPPRDALGALIPVDGWAFWERREEVSDFTIWVGSVKKTLSHGKKSLDPLYARVKDTTIGYLEYVEQDLLRLIPYAVCRACRGEPSMRPDGCDACGNTGLMSKMQVEELGAPSVLGEK